MLGRTASAATELNKGGKKKKRRKRMSSTDLHESAEDYTEENRFLIRVDSPISLKGATRKKINRRNATGRATESDIKLNHKIEHGGGDIHTIQEIDPYLQNKDAYVSILDVDELKDSKHLHIQDSKESHRKKMLKKP